MDLHDPVITLLLGLGLGVPFGFILHDVVRLLRNPEEGDA